MYDAMRYRNLVKKRGNATSKRKVLRTLAGAKKRPTAIKANDRKKANNAFKRVVDQSKARLILF